MTQDGSYLTVAGDAPKNTSNCTKTSGNTDFHKGMTIAEIVAKCKQIQETNPDFTLVVDGDSKTLVPTQGGSY